jgi:hypothetical protein
VNPICSFPKRLVRNLPSASKPAKLSDKWGFLFS